MPSTLYEYYTQQGQQLPSISERAKKFQELGLGSATDYSGSIQQNAMLLSRLSSTPVQNTKSIAQTPANTSSKKSIADIAKDTVPNFADENYNRLKSENDRNQKLIDQRTGDLVENEKERIRAAQRAAIQAQVDAMNQATEAMISRFRNTTAKSREGQSYALAAAGGRIGSATGESEIRQTEDRNNEDENLYRQENAVKVAALYGKANTDALTEIEKRRAAIQKGQEDYITYASTASQNKQKKGAEFIKGLLAQGYTLDEILNEYDKSDTLKKNMSDAYLLDRSSIVNAYNTAKSEKEATDLETQKSKADLFKANSFDLSEGQAKYTFDPVTGEPKLIASRAKTYAPKDGTGTSTGSGNPAVDAWVSQIHAGSATIANVPAALKNAVVQALNSSAPADNSDYQIGVLESALENVKKTKGAAGASGVGKFLGDAFIGNTQYRQLEAYIDTVKSNLLALATDPSIKKFFGPQMSNRDVELMTSIASSIDAQRLKPEQIQEEITKIEGFIQKLRAAKNSAGTTDTSAGASPEQNALRNKYNY